MKSFRDAVKAKYGKWSSDNAKKFLKIGMEFEVVGQNSNSHNYGKPGSRIRVDDHTFFRDNCIGGGLRNDGSHGNFIRSENLMLVGGNAPAFIAVQEYNEAKAKIAELEKEIEKYGPLVDVISKYSVTGDKEETFMRNLTMALWSDDELDDVEKAKQTLMVIGRNE
jgi:DNA-binding Lrp family transcriptional regulator